MHAFIQAIEYYLPPTTLSTADLSILFPEWSVEAIDLKTGICDRHIASSAECASDLGVSAAKQLFQSGICQAKDIDFLLFCTQSPDYALPTTACLLQDRLGIRTSAGAIDYNLGCSGFVYGLGLAEGLIATEQAERILLITAETYSKYIQDSDKGSRTIFGDGAAATLLGNRNDRVPAIGPFVYGTDGRGFNKLIVKDSGARQMEIFGESHAAFSKADSRDGFLFMDGAQVFQFAVETVPRAVKTLLDKVGMTMNEIDLFVFHQANAYLLEEIRRILDIPREKYYISIHHCANTVSSTIPIALKDAECDGTLRNGAVVMLVGFGVGYSWSATLLRWSQYSVSAGQ